VFFTGGNNWEKKKSDKDVECFNCHKKGHKKVNCWAKGSGKEGQGPRSKSKNEEPKKETASTAIEEEVWMAMVNNSDDEHMADDKFNNFTNQKTTYSFQKKKKRKKFKDSLIVSRSNSK
jgi:hypothetical protein